MICLMNFGIIGMKSKTNSSNKRYNEFEIYEMDHYGLRRLAQLIFYI